MRGSQEQGSMINVFHRGRASTHQAGRREQTLRRAWCCLLEVSPKGWRGRERERSSSRVLVLGPLRRRPSLWLTLVRQFTKHILVSLYFFIGSGYEHIHFILGEPEIVYFWEEGCENMQEGKVISWRLRLFRYIISMEKGSMCCAVWLNASGPLSWQSWLCSRAGTGGWEEAAPLLPPHTFEILRVWACPLHQILCLVAWSHVPYRWYLFFSLT